MTYSCIDVLATAQPMENAIKSTNAKARDNLRPMTRLNCAQTRSVPAHTKISQFTLPLLLPPESAYQ